MSNTNDVPGYGEPFTRTNRGRRYPIGRSHAILEAWFLSTEVIQLRADNSIRRCRKETIKAVSAYQKRHNTTLGCPNGWRQIAFQHIHSAGIADQYAKLWVELLDARLELMPLQTARQWCILLGGMSGTTATNPDDCPDIEPTTESETMKTKTATNGRNGKNMFYLNLRDDQCEIDVVLNAETLEDAISLAPSEAEKWCENSEWGIDGAFIDIQWTIYADEENQEPLEDGSCTVKIKPNRDALIHAAGGDVGCKHEWTSAGEGGCNENPGVWSTGGTSMLFAAHCTRCGLHRVERHTGSQRNPGEHDTVEYEQPNTDD